MPPARIFHGDLWGSREDKYRVLAETDVATTSWRELAPQSSFYLFTPQDTVLLQEYQPYWKVTDIFPVNSVGIVTARDGLTIRWSAQEVWDTVQDFAALSEEEARAKYRLGEDVQDWKVSWAQSDVRRSGPRQDLVIPVLYRPFDVRFTYYTGESRGFICRPRTEVMRHMLAGENVALCVGRAGQVVGPVDWDLAFCAHSIDDFNLFYRGGAIVFPLYLYPSEQEVASGLYRADERRPNPSPQFVAEMEQRLGAQFRPHPPSPSPSTERGWPQAGGEVTPSAERGWPQAEGAVSPAAGSPSPQGERGPGGEVSTSRWRTPPDLWERLKPLARQMRRQPTAAENLVWQRLRNRQLLGFKFRRQHTIERFIVDFYCREARLIIEVDGPTHDYTREEDAVRQEFLERQGVRVLRFTNEEVHRYLEAVLESVASALSERQTALANTAGEDATFTPEDAFHYIYAVLHCPTYRSRYAEFLKIDFPRVPLTSGLALFRTLAALGTELVLLHLLDSPVLANFTTRYPVPGSNRVERVRYDAAAQRVVISADQYFEGVPPEVWDFHVGGYQVCDKWLKDRRGRILSYDDLTHYQRIIGALKETIRLMGEIDRLIPTWPLA